MELNGTIGVMGFLLLVVGAGLLLLPPTPVKETSQIVSPSTCVNLTMTQEEFSKLLEAYANAREFERQQRMVVP